MLLIRAEQIEAMRRAARERLARATVEELHYSSPHAMLGLSEAETEARLQTALAKAGRYSLDTVRDIRAFVRLCYRVGPNFDEYPPFQRILTSGSSSPLGTLFLRASDEDWIAAAVYDIVGRSRDVTEAALGEHASPAFLRTEGVGLSLAKLTLEHAAAYHEQALHPDVWRLAGLEPLTEVEDLEDQIRAVQDTPNQEAHAMIHASAGFVGAIILDHDGPEADLFYWVGRPFWGKGIATVAVTQRIAMLRGHPTIRQVTAEVYVGNLPSLRVVEKSGFTPVPEEAEEGTLRYRVQI